MNTIILVGIVIVVSIYCIYFKLIQKRNLVQEASAGIDVQLKKRYDLMPNVLVLAQKYMEHEKSLIEEVTRLRTEALKMANQPMSAEKIKVDENLQDGFNKLVLSAENYPDLKSNQTMIQAMQTFSEAEEQISAARRFYNSSVNELKNMAEVFPFNLFALLFGVKVDMPFFEAAVDERKVVKAQDYFK